MKPLVPLEENGYKSCDVVAASSHEDCMSLCRYFEEYWNAEINEVFDTGFAAKFEVKILGRFFILSHDSKKGNVISAPHEDIDKLVPEILLDLQNRLSRPLK